MPSKRDLALFFKDPESHAGRAFALYCKVTQLDTFTGPDAFMADAAGDFDPDDYFDGSSAWFTALREGRFAKVVEGDVLRVTATANGEYEYTTVMGGHRDAAHRNSPGVLIETPHLVRVSG